MDYPLRTVIRCSQDGQTYGSVVVIRGDPMYDENHNLIGYKQRFMQIRRGDVKGKACREFFDSLDEWHDSMGLYNNKYNVEPRCSGLDVMFLLFTVFAMLIGISVQMGALK